MYPRTIEPAHDLTNTIPHWWGQFTRGGVTYDYAMVGTDPRAGSVTTTIPTIIIPLRFVYPRGTVFDSSTDLVDGQTAIDGIMRSPVMQPYPFNFGGTSVGTTQFGDAFQRANFWNSISRNSPGYHVLLEPRVAGVQTIEVPYESEYLIFDGDVLRPGVGVTFLQPQLDAIAAALGIRTDSLPIFVTGAVFPVFDADSTNIIVTGGYHWSTLDLSTPLSERTGAQTSIVTGYFASDVFGGIVADISVPGHEVLEWLNYPFTQNQVPGCEQEDISVTWATMYLLEVCDPVEDRGPFEFPTKSFTYHLEDGVFLDWFTRAPRSSSLLGRYDLLGLFSGPNPPCIGDTPIALSQFDAPGAAFTVARGVNDLGDVVGYYFDAAFTEHGFIRRNGTTVTLDLPGAAGGTIPVAINDFGDVVGQFVDSANGYHGFLLDHRGKLSVLDFPGAVNTYVEKINQWGDVVGAYDEAGTLLTRGFVFRHGNFATFDTPLGIQTVLTGINDLGQVCGYAADANGNVLTGFVGRGADFTPLSFPGGTHDTIPLAIDDRGRVAGYFFTDELGYEDGFRMETDGSFIRLLLSPVFGANNLGVMAASRDNHGSTATVPSESTR